MNNHNTEQVFISYATPDRDRVETYYDWLSANGLTVWMDCHSIIAGQHWDFEIKRALGKSSFIIMFISNNSYNRRGYLQREIKIAVDQLSEKLAEDIYIIPVVLDDNVEIPIELRQLQCIYSSDAKCKEKLLNALEHQLTRLGKEKIQTQIEQGISWSMSTIQESWDGLPGYEFEANLFSFTSKIYSNVNEIGEYLKGYVLKHLLSQRSDKLSQHPDHFNYGQDSFYRTNTFDMHCDDPVITGKVITIEYLVSWYGAGAAHPNHYFDTFSFILDPLILISSPQEIFNNDKGQTLQVLQKNIREELLTVSESDGESLLDKEHIEEGTKNWSDLKSFVFKETGIEFLFAPYQVGCYAVGPQSALVPYKTIADFIKPVYKSALGIQYISSTS